MCTRAACCHYEGRRRYALGYVDYFEVVDSDRDALPIERDAIHARQALAVATVGLVRALGGGWSVPARAGVAEADAASARRTSE